MYAAYLKRFFDVAGSLMLLFLLSWLFLIIYFLYLVSFSFPVLFKQDRIGKKDVPFLLFKFRTLKSNNLNLDQRKFPLGTLLRSTSLDELPQLINVLRGEMSLIGPRPLLVEYLPLFNSQQRQRHLVRPGITGWAQVNGRHSISWQQKFEYDLYYVHHISLWLDIKITLKTIGLLLSLKKDRSLQEEKFTGNA